MNADDLPLFGALVAGVLVLHFVPAMIAYGRAHPDRRTIASLNVLALVSFLLWAALLGWAALGRRNGSVIDRYVDDRRTRRLAAAGLGALFVAGAATTAMMVA